MEMLYPMKYSFMGGEYHKVLCSPTTFAQSFYYAVKHNFHLCFFFPSHDRYFVQSMDFTGMEVDEALRVYQTSFRLPVCFFSSVYLQKLISINLTICCKRSPVGLLLIFLYTKPVFYQFEYRL